jgi:hypothetical protein
MRGILALTQIETRAVVAPDFTHHRNTRVEDQSMKMISIAAALCLAASASVAYSAEQGGFGVGGPSSYIWAELGMKRMMMSRDIADKNKDGMVSKDEYMAFAEMTSGKDFMMMDMNNDGMVSEVEWTSSNLHPTSTFYGAFR